MWYETEIWAAEEGDWQPEGFEEEPIYVSVPFRFRLEDVREYHRSSKHTRPGTMMSTDGSFWSMNIEYDAFKKIMADFEKERVNHLIIKNQ
jgi:hypothetical protein